MASVDRVYGRKWWPTYEDWSGFASGFLVFSRMAALLKRYLEYNRFITIEAYDPSRHYDLLITNNPIHKKEQTPVYYLKNDLDMEDLAKIRQMLFA